MAMISWSVMPCLYTMCNPVANTLCNRTQNVYGTIRNMLKSKKMHDTAMRLYEAAESIAHVSGQTEVASALGLRPQVLNNWEARGVSKAGALAACKLWNVRFEWLMGGTPPMLSEADPLLQQLIEIYSALPAEYRDWLLQDANRHLNRAFPGTSAADPFAKAPKAPVKTKDKHK